MNFTLEEFFTTNRDDAKWQQAPSRGRTGATSLRSGSPYPSRINFDTSPKRKSFSFCDAPKKGNCPKAGTKRGQHPPVQVSRPKEQPASCQQNRKRATSPKAPEPKRRDRHKTPTSAVKSTTPQGTPDVRYKCARTRRRTEQLYRSTTLGLQSYARPPSPFRCSNFKLGSHCTRHRPGLVRR